MKAITQLKEKLGQIVPPRHSGVKPKHFIRLGCAALALTLAVGSVPFLRGWAADEETAVSGSDIVTQSDTVVVAGETVEPKPANSVIGGIDWQRMESVDDLNNAALSSKSTITSSMVSTWVKNYLDEFMEENGYTDATQLAFIYHYTDSWVGTSRRTQYGISTGETYLSNYANNILFYIPRVPATSVTLSHTRLDLNVGDAVTLTGELTPADTNDRIVWSTTDKTVVSIDEKGNVSAVGCGDATIKATVYNDVYEIPVTVSGQPYVEALEHEINDWILAESFDDLKNAAYFDKSNIAKWYSWNSRKYPNRKWVYKYDPDEEKAYYKSIKSGEVTEDNFSSLTNLYYFPKPATSFTYHAAVEPTCTEDGNTAYWTDQDGNKFADANTETPLTDEEIPVAALGHNWGEWTETTPATCTQPGEETRTCQNDPSHTETREIAALGHDWSEVIDTEPTCEETGVKHEECSVCHEKRNEGTVIDATGHDWDYWVTTTPATCAAPGEKTRTCKNDPSHTETEEIPALSHNWYAWTAVEGQPGLLERDCAECGEHETRIHPFLQFVVAAGDGQTYTKGTKEPITVKFDKEDIPDLRKVDVYQMFTNNGGSVNVTAPDGTVTTLGAGDFTPSKGSLDVTLSAGYLEGLGDGDYTMTVTFVVAPDYEKTSAAASFTVSSPAPAGSDSPATGESIAMISVSLALLLLAAYGAVYALRHRRALGE